MLVASRSIGLFDRYRIPYSVDPSTADGFVRIGRPDRAGPQVLSLSAAPNTVERSYLLDGAFLHVGLADTAAVDAALSASGQAWEVETPILQLDGVQRAAVLRGSDGSVLLPFDIDAPFEALLEERYLSGGNADRVRALVRTGYYRARPLLPRPLQLALRRRFRRLQERAVLPAWPTETSLHRLEALMLALVQRVAGEPVPWLSAWPAPYTWAMVLTHDVEQAAGYALVAAVRAVEERHGLRSAWYFVPERDYRVEDSVLNELRASDCEICLHGLRHDGRDMSPKVFADRLPAMRSYAERWGARGFRGPSTLRNKDLLPQLRVDHDSSWSDVARYEPQPGGSCSWLPFFIGNVVELPITLPQDHTLFELHGEHTEAPWLEKAAFLRENEGMALMLTHPDYMLDSDRMSVYERFIRRQAEDATAWHALPHEVAGWWRRRADSHIERHSGSWIVAGPAAPEASVRLDVPLLPPISTATSSL